MKRGLMNVFILALLVVTPACGGKDLLAWEPVITDGAGAGGRQAASPVAAGSGGARNLPAQAGSAGQFAEPVPSPVQGREWWIDPNAGDDANGTGTREAPLRSIKKALDSARFGDTLKLLDGEYTRATEPAFDITGNGYRVPHGVNIVAEHSGGAVLVDARFAGGPGAFILEGSSDLSGVEFRGFSPALLASQGVVNLHDLHFSAVDKSTCGETQASALIQLSEAVRARLTQASRGPIGSGVACLVRLRDSAELQVSEVSFHGAVNPQTHYTLPAAVIAAHDDSKLSVHTSAFRSNALTSVLALDKSTVVLDGRSSFEAGNIARTPVATLVSVLDDASLAMNQVKFDGHFHNCLAFGRALKETEASLKLELHDVSFDACENAFSTANEPNAEVIFDRVSVENSSGYGTPSLAFGGKLEITSSKFVQNFMSGLNLQVVKPLNIKVRGTTFDNNGGNGLSIVTTADVTVDLGRASDPGNNALRSENTRPGGTSFSLQADGTSKASVYAIGNVWNPWSQGTDANGKYSTATSAALNSPQSGANYVLTGQNGGSVVLHLTEP